jgi:RimJ/RimL family protein N-acetyltransferase
MLETERLLLRRPDLSDFDRWAEMMRDPEAARFIGGTAPPTVVWRMIVQMAGAWELTGVSMFSVIEKSSGLWIGRVGPWRPFGWPGDEVGWALRREAWGKGYAFEAAVACMNYAFDVLGWPEVIHCINPQNIRSQELARRLGSTILRRTNMPEPNEHEVVDIWGQSRSQWLERRAAI